MTICNMGVFTSSPYFEQAAQNIGGEGLIETIQTSPLQYSYVHLPYSDYKPDSTSQPKPERLSQTVVATVKMIAYLAKTLFYNLPRSIYAGKDVLKLDSYSACCHGMTALGHLVSPFSTKLSHYLLEKSVLQQECYLNKEAPKNGYDRDFCINYMIKTKPRIYHIDEAKKITLLGFKNMREEEQTATIKKYQLQRLFAQFESGSEKAFLEWLSSQTDALLKKISLFNAQIDCVMKYAFMDYEKFKDLKLSDLDINYEFDDAQSIIFERITSYTSSTQWTKAQIPELALKLLPIIYLPCCPIEKIDREISECPDRILHLLTQDQLKGVKLSSLSQEQLYKLDRYANFEELLKEKLKTATDDEVKAIVEKCSVIKDSLCPARKFRLFPFNREQPF